MKDVNIIFGITGTYCAFPKIIEKIKELANNGANIFPVMSFYAYYLCVHFNNNYIEKIESITHNKVVHTLTEAEMFSKKINADIMIIAPTSGNTIAKLAESISDTPVTIVAQSHLKYKKPLVIFIYAVDGLSTNACNIGKLLNKKDYFIVPFRQENPITKPYSLSSDPEYILKTLDLALHNEQIEPLLL